MYCDITLPNGRPFAGNSMLICGEESIREIIPFPMNKNAMDIMMGAPATVDQKQLDDVHIRIQMPEEK